jgi:transketolase
MGAAMNGLALMGLRSYGSGFLIFSDYSRPTLRLASLMELPVIYIFTHDSIGVGEDGPTHQPIEHLASLRAIPHLTVLRPADGNEVAEAWKVAMEIHQVHAWRARACGADSEPAGLADYRSEHVRFCHWRQAGRLCPG